MFEFSKECLATIYSIKKNIFPLYLPCMQSVFQFITPCIKFTMRKIKCDYKHDLLQAYFCYINL